MFQLLYTGSQSLFFGAFSFLAAVVTTQVNKAFLTVSIGTKFLGKAPEAGITENIRIDTVLFENFTYGFTGC